MAETHVISALVSKRSELAGMVAFHYKEISRITEEVKALDAAIKIFEPAYRINSINPKRYQKKIAFFKHGEGSRAVLDILRESGKPLSISDITSIVMLKKGISGEHKKFLAACIAIFLNRIKQHQCGTSIPFRPP
jgi:hypothetical protein